MERADIADTRNRKGLLLKEKVYVGMISTQEGMRVLLGDEASDFSYG